MRAARAANDVLNIPAETWEGMCAASEKPDDSSLGSDLSQSFNQLSSQKLANELTVLDDQIAFAKAGGGRAAIATRNKLPELQQRRAAIFQELSERHTREFPQNPTREALSDPAIPGNALQKTVAGVAADPWGTMRSAEIASISPRTVTLCIPSWW